MATINKSFSNDCLYYKTSYGYESGCGYRAAYNKFWHWCPYCRRPIVVLNEQALEDVETKHIVHHSKRGKKK